MIRGTVSLGAYQHLSFSRAAVTKTFEHICEWMLALRVVVYFSFQKLLMAVSCHYPVFFLLT